MVGRVYYLRVKDCYDCKRSLWSAERRERVRSLTFDGNNKCVTPIRYVTKNTGCVCWQTHVVIQTYFRQKKKEVWKHGMNTINVLTAIARGKKIQNARTVYNVEYVLKRFYSLTKTHNNNIHLLLLFSLSSPFPLCLPHPPSHSN